MNEMLSSIVNEFQPPPVPPPTKLDPLQRFDKFFEATVREAREDARKQREEEKQKNTISEQHKSASFERYLRSVVNVPLSYEIFKEDYKRLGIPPPGTKPPPQEPNLNNYF